uniref:hypothetical protein n=1 Tax=Blastopirellula marina TaxID=124 RepID=UPI0036F3B0B6
MGERFRFFDGRGKEAACAVAVIQRDAVKVAIAKFRQGFRFAGQRLQPFFFGQQQVID